MGFVDRVIRRMGGIATTAELNRWGVEDVFIQVEAHRRVIVRIKRGWYACPEVPASVIDAIRAGGRLTCVSALRYYGLWSQPEALHVAVPRSASKRTSSLPTGQPIVMHWSRAQPSGTRYAVSVEEAWAQAKRCRALT
jgi:predicted transcriptional regulator of viral defense system